MTETRDDPVRRLRGIMAKLRDPNGGCPWDIEQSFASIAPYTIEEAYEVADAIQREDIDGLLDELGDLLLQVVFHARMAEEAGHFDLDAVAEAICDKMVRRHPHVFGNARVTDAAAQTAAWEEHKAVERRAKAGELGLPNAHPSALDGVTVALPALTRAAKLQKRAARVGFDWPDAAAALAKFGEEAAELSVEMADGGDPDRLEDEVGDLLFSCVNVARKLDVDPEHALRRANGKFERRFRHIERALAADGGRRPETESLETLEALWNEAKRAG